MTTLSYRCPTCNAAPGEPCRTPKGRKKEGIHDTRPFSIEFAAPSLKQHVDEVTRGMMESFDSPFAKEMRRTAGISDEQARELIREQRKQFGLPSKFDDKK